MTNGPTHDEKKKGDSKKEQPKGQGSAKGEKKK